MTIDFAGVTDPCRPLYTIALEILKDWGKQKSGIYFAALPYLEAMATMHNITDKYGADDGKYIVVHFLGNAGLWRGDVARRVKAELKAMTK
jgi:hypothetical protein